MEKLNEGLSVRCINSDFHDSRENPFKISDLNLPKEGESYTVRETIDTSYGKGILLVEIHNGRYYFNDVKELREPIFAVDRFEVVERQAN